MSDVGNLQRDSRSDEHLFCTCSLQSLTDIRESWELGYLSSTALFLRQVGLNVGTLEQWQQQPLGGAY